MTSCSNGKLKLLLVTSTWPLFKGDHRTPFVRDLAYDLAERGWSVNVLAPHAQNAKYEELDGPLQVRRFRYMWPASAQTLAYGGGALINYQTVWGKLQALPFVLAEVAAIRKAIREHRPSIVHAHWLVPQGFSAGVATLGTSLPLVTTVHGGDVFALRSWLMQPFKRAAVRWSKAITCNGLPTRDAVLDLGADAGKVSVIRMAPSFEGVVSVASALSWRSRFPTDAKIVLFVGRLIDEKGPIEFVEAIARARHRQIHGVICGDGPLRIHLEKLVAARGLKDRISFEGWIGPEEIAVRMHAADALLFPSKTAPDGWVEAQGVVLIEAMRAGLLIFAARSGGIAQIIRDGETGWLFEEANVDSMAQLLDRWLAGQLRDTSDITARAKRIAVSELTRDNTAESFHELFLTLLGETDHRYGGQEYQKRSTGPRSNYDSSARHM